MSKTFRLKCEKVHFTYPTHIDEDAAMALFKSFGTLKLYSFVHELGDAEEDNGYPEGHEGPYAHTHVFVWWKTAIDVKNARAFDLPNPENADRALHPNMQNKRGMDWAKTIVQKYHKGFKTKANGKKYFLAPEYLFQKGVETWQWEDEMFDICLNAPTLIDACKQLDMQPKSIADVNLIRKQGKRKDFSYPERVCELDMLKPRQQILDAGWNPAEEVLILKGSGGRGKTNWALCQSPAGKAHLITTMDDLKKVRDDCDLLVFDEILFGSGRHKQEKAGLVALTDMKYPRSVWARNNNIVVPAVPRIFCVNEHEHVFGVDPNVGAHFSIQRRCFEWDIDEHWGYCYYKKVTEDGVARPLIPSNGPFPEESRASKKRKLDELDADAVCAGPTACTNPNCPCKKQH